MMQKVYETLIDSKSYWATSKTGEETDSSFGSFREAVLAINNASERDSITDVQKELLLRIAASSFVQRKFEEILLDKFGSSGPTLCPRCHLAKSRHSTFSEGFMYGRWTAQR